MLLAATIVVLAGFLALSTFADGRERQIAARSHEAPATVLDVSGGALVVRYEVDGAPFEQHLRFSPRDMEGQLVVGERVEVLVDDRAPTRVHLPGNNTALVGEAGALLLSAAPLVVLVLVAATGVSWYRFLRR